MDYDHTDHSAPDGVSAQEDAPPPVILSLLMQSAINASLWENSVPVLQELSLKNQGEDELSLVEISVSSEPPFLLPRSWRLQQVAAGQLHLVKDLDIRLDGARLAAHTEASRATVAFVASAGGRELMQKSRDVRVLARNKWGGLSGILIYWPRS
ncbi:hypothetical protein [Lichenicoccus roseus]|uniref:hypothetical protein n=1 Tax=Lichenicoccus roseus TaxID=2683649 RepID=UPI001F105B50|nr:hypothetical protein [Lichenicoccus roseus]